MIRLGGLLHILGLLLVILAGSMAVPIAYGAATDWGGVEETAKALALTLGTGTALWRGFRKPASELSQREGILLTGMAWLAVSIFAALPFWFSPYFASFTDALFESVSSFTTTGATVLKQVEVLPGAIQFWRHFGHWLGGMGVVLLCIAVLPLIGAGGMALYRAEFSGARSEKLQPRLAETALSLWRIYFALTLAQYTLLRVAGLGPFDAACHSFSTMGTGGFSTLTASVGGFRNPAVEYIIITFMFLAGLNFTQHYRLWVRRDARSFFGDVEVRGFATILAGAAALTAWGLLTTTGMGVEEAVRAALFQTVSIGTTTGFATADYEQWMPVSHTVLLVLMFVGGCTGSTAGGWKVARVLLLGKLVYRELLRTSHRRGVFAVRVGGQVIPEATIQSLLNLVYLSLLVFLVSFVAVSAAGVDLLTSITAVAAAMFSVGPGFGTVGPADNYSHLPDVVKWVLTFCMLAGRLEFYTAIVVFTPPFWRK